MKGLCKKDEVTDGNILPFLLAKYTKEWWKAKLKRLGRLPQGSYKIKIFERYQGTYGQHLC